MQAAGPPLPADVPGQGEHVLEGEADPVIAAPHLQRGLLPVRIRALGQDVGQRIEMGQRVFLGLDEPRSLGYLFLHRDRGLWLVGLQHVAFQPGDMDILEIRLPVDSGDVPVEAQPVLRIEPLVQRDGTVRFEGAFQGGVGDYRSRP